MMHYSKKREQGAALITALFIMVLVTIASVVMCMQIAVTIQETKFQIDDFRRNNAVISEQNIAFNRLAKDATDYLKKHEITAFPLQLETVHENGMEIRGKITDAEARFNLNNLRTVETMDAFVRLMAACDAGSNETAHALAVKINAWLNTVTEKGNMNAKPPVFVDISQLRTFPGVNAKLYQKLLPYITVLPKKTPININTATVPVLMTLAPEMTRSLAETIVDTRKNQGGFKRQQDFQNVPGIADIEFGKTATTLVSDYFILKTSIKQDGLTYHSWDLINRQWNIGKVSLFILRHEIK